MLQRESDPRMQYDQDGRQSAKKSCCLCRELQITNHLSYHADLEGGQRMISRGDDMITMGSDFIRNRLKEIEL